MKRFLSFLLVLVMCFGLVFPASAFASEAPTSEDEVVDAMEEILDNIAANEATPPANEADGESATPPATSDQPAGDEVADDEGTPAPETTPSEGTADSEATTPPAVQPTTEPTEQPSGDPAPTDAPSAQPEESDGPSITDGTLQIYFVRDDADAVQKVTFSEPAVKVEWKHFLNPEDSFNEIDLTANNPAATINGNEVIFSNEWLLSMPDGNYNLRFTFADGSIVMLPMLIKQSYDPIIDESELGEDGLTDEQREKVEDLRAKLEALPSLEDLCGMQMEEQNEVYNELQGYYDIWNAQSEIVKMLVGTEVFEELFAYFNSLTSSMYLTQKNEPANLWTLSPGVTYRQVYANGDDDSCYNMTEIHGHTMDGYGVVYCLDAPKPAGGTYTQQTPDWWWTHLNNWQRTAIQKILTYGYPNCDQYNGKGHNHDATACRAATQALVWSVTASTTNGIANSDGTFYMRDNIFYPSIGSAQTQYQEILFMAANHLRGPSWLYYEASGDEFSAEAHKNRFEKYDSGKGVYTLTITDVTPDSSSEHIIDGSSIGLNSRLNKVWFANLFDYPDWDGWTFTTDVDEQNRLTLTVEVTPQGLLAKGLENPDGVITAGAKAPWNPDTSTPILFRPGTETVDSSAYQVMGKQIYLDPDTRYIAFEGFPRFPLGINKTANVLESATRNTVETVGGYTDWDLTWKSYVQEGAVFSLYAAEDIKSQDGSMTFFHAGDRITDLDGNEITLTTNASGYAETEPLYCGKYRVHEEEVPEGYSLHEDVVVEIPFPTEVEEVKDVYTVDIENKPAVPEIKVIKEDDATGVGLEDAILGLFTAEEIVTHDGTTIPVDSCIELVHTDEHGEAVFGKDQTKKLVPANHKYYVQEISAPTGYVFDNSLRFDVNFVSNKDNADKTVIQYQSTFDDTLIVGEFNITKEDLITHGVAQGDAELVGKLEEEFDDWAVAGEQGFDGVYGLYAREDIIHMDGKTNNAKDPDSYLNDGRGDGVLFKANELVKEFKLELRGDGTYGFSISKEDTFDSGSEKAIFYAGGVPLGKYYVKEISPPYGYKMSDTEYDIEVLPPVDKQTIALTVSDTATVYDDVIVQVHQFIKVKGVEGSESYVGEPLLGAGFSAWLESDLIAAGYVNEDGTGYIPPSDAQGNIQWDKGVVQPVKIGRPGEPNTIDPESHTSGATKSHEAGKFPADGTVIYSMHEGQGDVQTIPLPFGRYIFREVDTPKDYKPIEDFVVTTPTYPENRPIVEPQVDHDNPAPHFWQTGIDTPIRAFIKVYKGDTVTNKTVLKGGAKYLIYNEAGELVIQTRTYPKMEDVGTEENPFETTDDGTLITVEALNIGKYTLKEVAAPDGYVLPEYDEIPDNDNGIEFEVTSTNPTIYLDDGIYGKSPVFVIPITMKNAPQVGDFTLAKTGDTVAKFEDGKFTYEPSPIDGAKFEVRAKEDIYTPDNQLDEFGNRTLNTYNGVKLSAGALVATLTTGADGTAKLEGLPLGTYTVKETDPSKGYILDGKTYEFTLSYEGDKVSRVKASLEINNTKEDLELSLIKYDDVQDKPVAGAEFTLYAAEDIYAVPYGRDTAGAKKLVSANEAICTVTSDAAGNIVFPEDLDLPLGKYYAVETKAPDGYVPTKDDNIPENDRIDFNGEYAGMDTPVVEIKDVRVVNYPTEIQVMKIDSRTENPIYGAHFRIVDKNGTTVDEWQSEKGTDHITYCLHIGEQYTLVEDMAPYGYLKSQDVKFTVQNTVEIQTIEMRDDVPSGHIIIDKDGEVLDSVSFMQTLKGWLTSLFNWITGSLQNITFEVRAEEDIKAADGVSPDYYKAGDLVAEITTDASGVAELREVEYNGKMIGLPLGKYVITEKETKDGYILDTEPRHVDLPYIDQYTAIVHYTDSWMNERIPMDLSIHKVDAEDKSISLEGATFALYCKQDILNVRGEVAVKAGTHLAERATDENGNIKFDIDAPAGYEYAVKELVPPVNHVTNTEEFVFNFDGTEHELLSGVMLFEIEDEQIKVPVYKQSTTGETVIGAHLEVRDAENKVIDSWVTEDAPHYVWGLSVGGTYTLVETQPADGYVTADPVEFTVKDTPDEQPIYMKDAPTTIEVSKKSTTTGEELPGAKLTVYDEDNNVIDSWTSTTEPHILTKLVVGKTYTLHEDLAPLGYATASDVEFTVQDTPDVQKVEMFDDITKLHVSKKDITDMEELPGARLEIHDSEGNVVDSWESTDQPHYVEGLHVGEKYTLHETRPADGYATAEVVEFTIQDTGDIQYVEMLDAPIEVDISKKDATTGEELPGAKLQLFDEDGVLIEEWTSADVPHRVEHLIVGKTYTLHEDLAPLGYATASNVEFTIRDTGDVQKVEMFDEITKVDISKKDATTGDELPGAKLQLFDKDGNLIDEWTSTDVPHHIEGLHVGEKYTLHEDLAPLGYATASDVEFTIQATGDVQKVEMIDEIIKVDISKKDATTGEELPGAKLQLFDKDGNLVDEWTSTEEPHRIEGLHVGEKYTLHEDLAPLGYATASDVEFVIEDTGEVQEVEMLDEIITVEVSKKDATTGEELPGAKLQVLDKDGNIVDEWTSTEEPHIIEGLHVGETYTLHEDLAPLGYATASDVEFTIEDTGEVQEVEMLDEIIQVAVSKKNVSGKELPGAKLQVKDKDGNIIDEWTSTDEPHIIEGLHVGEKYTLHEDLAPLGYAKASDVEFVIEDTGEVQKVEMIDELLPSETPKTGDNGNLLALLATGTMLMMAVIGCGYGIYRRKKEHGEG